jgi:RNA polymerase sigma-70 factor (ECF subfamily)
MTGNEQDAEAVVQESFLRAYRQLGRFESRANFGTWLYRLVSHCSVDLMRSQQARHDQVRGDRLDEVVELPAGDGPGPERMAQSAEIERRVQAALGELSPLERAAFTLRHYEGRSIEEISAALNLGTSAAKHSVFRAVKKLRIEGHTDNVGDDGMNLKLSEGRAKAVREALTKRGVDGDRLETAGLGETRPIAPNDTPGGRQKNRRVEFIIVGGGK